jgi:hypothetical protein
MTVPQPFQHQGSQRALAPLILQYLPIGTTRLVDGCHCAAGAGGGFDSEFCFYFPPPGVASPTNQPAQPPAENGTG